MDPDLKVEVFFGKVAEQKKGALISNRALRHVCTLALGVDEKFMQSLPAFFVF